MPSRRRFVADAAALALLGPWLEDAAEAQRAASTADPQDATADLPHDSMSFWSGFFDSVNPLVSGYGTGAAKRGPTDQLPDPNAMTQYLHFSNDEKKFRYANQIASNELLDHAGDVAVSISLSQYWDGTGNNSGHASQFRVDATQTKPLMNIVAPLAWTAIASLRPDMGGSVSMDSLGFKSIQATQGTSNILLNEGTGKLAVNISRAPVSSPMIKMLNAMITGAKMVVPMLTLPAISVPALNSFSEALSYWEERTKFVMAGNLTNAFATQQALKSTKESTYIGMVPGDYLMVPQRDTEKLGAVLENLELNQGYLVRKDGNKNYPVQTQAQNALPGITYATMHVSVTPLYTPTMRTAVRPAGSA